MGIDNYDQIHSSELEVIQNKNHDSKSNKQKKINSNNNQNINLNSSFNGFCGNFSINDILTKKRQK